MRRVASILPFTISPATWMAAIVVAAVSIAASLLIASRTASTEKPSFPQSALILPEPGQTPNRAAKAAREPSKQTRRTPDPSRAASQPPQDDVSSLVTLRQAPKREGGASAETGRASWYDFDTKTASGEAMNGDALTAAHPSLPFGSKVKVANLDNGREVVVRINDRGPFSKGRIIDVSRAAAEKLGMIAAGVARVSVHPIADAVANDELASAGGKAPPR
jgi:rare lipoprotein A